MKNTTSAQEVQCSETEEFSRHCWMILLLACSHGTLGSIKHQTNYRHQYVFSSAKSSNPGSAQSTGRDSASLHAHTCSSFSLLRCVLTASPAAPEPMPRAGIHPGQGYSPGPWSHGQVLFPALIPLARALSAGQSPRGFAKIPSRCRALPGLLPSLPSRDCQHSLAGCPAPSLSLPCPFAQQVPVCSFGAFASVKLPQSHLGTSSHYGRCYCAFHPQMKACAASQMCHL